MNEEDAEMEAELVRKREEQWLVDWGNSVVAASRLPLVVLPAHRKIVFKSGHDRYWTLPVSVKSEDWLKKNKRNVPLHVDMTKGLPHPSAVGWSEDLYKESKPSKRSGLNLTGLQVTLDKEFNYANRIKGHKDAENKDMHWNNTKIHITKPPAPWNTEGNKKTGDFLKVFDSASDDDLVPHFQILKLANYLPGSGCKSNNRHSESVLQIMLGHNPCVKEKAGGSSSRASSLGPSSSPTPPKEVDSTFTMDAFWADLGVEAPYGKTMDIDGGGDAGSVKDNTEGGVEEEGSDQEWEL